MQPAQVNAAKALWKRAYSALDEADLGILQKYAHENAQLNGILVEKRLREKELKEWAVRFGSKSIKVKEVGESIFGLIEFSKDYLAQVAASEPHAAIAWTCFAALIPMITDVRDQVESLLSGLKRVSFLIGFYITWEGLYVNDGTVQLQEAAVKVYTAILSYQARALDHLSRGTFGRAGRNMIKHDDWIKLLAEVDRRHDWCIEHGKLANIVDERQRSDYQEAFMKMQVDTAIQILDELKLVNQEKLERTDKDLRHRLLQCFASDHNSQKNVNPERVKGTCEWFTKDQKFLNWNDSRSSCLLHVSAGPGCGKSTLCRYLVDSDVLQTRDTTKVLFFFFKDSQQGQDRCANAITAILHQLYKDPSREHLMAHAMQTYAASGEKLTDMFYDLWEILQSTVKDAAAADLVCVVDALDECVEEDRGRFLNAATRFFSDTASRNNDGGTLKMLITSRPYSDIMGNYHGLDPSSNVLQLDGADKSDLIAAEINLVIEDQVPRMLPKLNKDIHETVIQQLKQYQNRTYLWLHLIMDFIKKNIARAGTAKKLKSLIDTLPLTVNAAYTAMLEHSTDAVEAQRLLQLVIVARRPLHVRELDTASLMIAEEPVCSQDLDTMEFDVFKNNLQDLCGLILTVHDSRVHFIHQTARTFLCQELFSIKTPTGVWKGPVQLAEAEALMSQACTSYLSLDDFKQQFEISELADTLEERLALIADRNKNFSGFIKYAASYWVSHSSDLDVLTHPDLLQRQAELCKPDSGTFWTWFSIPKYASLLVLIQEELLLMDPFCIACLLGHEGLVKFLFSKGAEVNTAHGLFPLEAACFRIGGHQRVVEFLLAQGADIYTKFAAFESPLASASRYEKLDILETFLSHGKGKDGHERYYEEILAEAALSDSSSVVELLLERGVSSNARDEGGDSAIYNACNINSRRVLDLLVEHGVAFDAEALYTAAQMGRTKFVEALIKLGGDPATYRKALHIATGMGHQEVANILIIRLAECSLGSRPKPQMAVRAEGGTMWKGTKFVARLR